MPPAGGFDFASFLAEASPALMLAIFVIALWRRWLILPRELDQSHARITQLEVERDEYKTMTFRLLDVNERVTANAEQGRR